MDLLRLRLVLEWKELIIMEGVHSHRWATRMTRTLKLGCVDLEPGALAIELSRYASDLGPTLIWE